MAKTTDELFAEATEADYETVEPVTLAASDTEEEFQFRIDEHLRTIAIPEKGVVAGVEGDLNVNIARFVMVRYYHGRDLSKLNIRINYRNANGQVNYYTVSDATVSGNNIVFSWEYAADVTQYKGNVQFVVYLFSTTNAVLKQRFFSTLGTLEVLEGLEVDSSIPASEQTDILLHLKKDLSAYAEEVKKSLPADYTAMTEQVSSLKEDLNTIRDDLNNITVGGVTSGFVRALQELFSAVAYWDSSKITNPSAKISALSSYIGGGSGNPSGSATVTGIAVVWSATSADVGTDPKTLITSVTAEYSDGTSKVVTSYSVNISSLVLGENNVVVSYLGFTDSKTITGNKVVNSLLSNLRSYKINVLMEPSYTIVSSGNTHTIDWNPDYTGNKIFQNGRAIGNCNIQNGKTYKVSTSEKITDVIYLYGFDVSVSGSEIDDVQSSSGTLVTTFRSGTKEVTFTASADFGYLRLAPVACPITLYDLVVEEV